MTPDFALSLSFEGIRLLQRAASGFRCVGEVSLEAEDLDASLRVLLKSAPLADPSEIRTKLLLPNDQIRYLTLETGEMDQEARRAAAEQALDGITPYAIDELCIDVVASGDTTHVAAVARETLAEAEVFLTAHGFNPVCFAATPDGTDFPVEPYFGPTQLAADLLPPDDMPEREPVPDTQSAEANGFEEDATRFSGVAASETIDLDDNGPAPGTEDNDPAPGTDDYGLAPETDDALAYIPEPEPAIVTPFISRRGSPATSGASPKLGGVTRADAPPVEATDDSDLLDTHPAEAEPALSFGSRRAEARAPTPSPAARRDTVPIRAHARPATELAASLTPSTPTLEEAQRLTIFGARDGVVQDLGRRPRTLAVSLVATVLVCLAGVTALASMFFDDGIASFLGDRPETVVATPSQPIVTPEALPGLTDLPPATEDDPAPQSVEVASLSTDLTDEDAAVLDALTDPRPEPGLAVPLSPDEIAEGYAVTGIWPAAPDAPEPAPLVGLDTLYETSIDPGSALEDAIALLAPPESEAPLDPIAPPAAPGARFDLDERGLVKATPEGTLNPDGVLVYLGPPPAKPDALPDRQAAASPDAGALPAIDARAIILREIRPRMRPSGLIEDNERATLAGLSRAELAGLRPAMRPAVERTPEEQQAEAAEAESLRNAMAASARPKPRSANFARIVARATPPAQLEQVAAVAPRTVAPSIPSSASVARQATVENAINLRRVNLIGVFGKPSERRALIRMPNGRYKKVRVGDRIDGGRVSAIGDNELRYQKGSRNLVLKMPKS